MSRAACEHDQAAEEGGRPASHSLYYTDFFYPIAALGSDGRCRAQLASTTRPRRKAVDQRHIACNLTYYTDFFYPIAALGSDGRCRAQLASTTRPRRKAVDQRHIACNLTYYTDFFIRSLR